MTAKKRLIIIAAIVIVLVVIVAISANARRKDLVSVQVGEVERTPELIAKVDATGEIKPKEYVELQSEIVGVITELFVDEGDFVQRGDLLVRIDPTQTEAETRAQEALLQAALMDANNQKGQITVQQTNLNRERASVTVAEAEVERARQALEFASNNFKRKQELFEQNLISRDLYEQAKNEEVTAIASLTSAKARLQQAKASLEAAEVSLEQSRNSHEAALRRVDQNRAILERSQDSLAKTTIRSPLTGVITQLNVEVGERAVPGTLNNPAATIMIIADLSVIEAEIEVDETDIVRVQLGQDAVVNVDALPNQPLKGVVTEIGNSAIAQVGQQEAKDFKVAIRLNDPPDTLRPGLSCTADITTAVRNDILTIPIQALTVRELPVRDDGTPILEDSEESGTTEEGPGESRTEGKKEEKDFEGVFVVKDRKVHFVPVTTGITGDTNIEILEGLDEGSSIVTGSYKALRTLNHGDRVKIEVEKEA